MSESISIKYSFLDGSGREESTENGPVKGNQSLAMLFKSE